MLSDQEKSRSDILPTHFEEDAMSVYDFIAIAVKHIKIIIIVPLIFSFCTFIYLSYYVEPFFTSTSKIMPSGSDNSAGSYASQVASQFGFNIGSSGGGPKWKYAEVIKSRGLASDIVQMKFDTEKFGSQKSLLQILTYGNRKPKFGIDTLKIFSINKFLKMIKVSEDLATGIITLKVNSFEPKFSYDINKAIINAVNKYQQKYTKSKTEDTRIFIEERILNTESELMEAEEKLKTFRDRNRRIQNSPALQLKQDRLAREVAVLTGVFTSLKQQLESTKIEAVKQSNYILVFDSPEIPLAPGNPGKKRVLIFMGLAGAFLGYVIAFFIDIFSKISDDTKGKLNVLKTALISNLLK